MAGVEATIRQNLNSDVATVAAIGKHIVESGGKRLRPMMAILVGRALGHSGPELITLAVLLEFLHTATLLHDDVVDVSQRRRGHKTVNLLWGNAPSVLVGDFLYSRAFQLMVELNHMQVMTVISDATNTIAEGEVKQLENVGNPDLTEAQYMDIIRCKSALLFQAATETGAVVANASSDEVEAARLFGLHFGLAYQLMDDLLDYAGDNDTLGKNVGDDLAEGKSTLPLIFAMRYGSGADAALIRQAIESKSTNDARRIIEVVRESGALGYVRTNAIAQTNLAKGALVRLPPNRYQDGLINLADIALERLQ
ncbi:MAG: octaprenyl diphosphate synthase [Gammaproteobacteria bacterium]|nr:octaprenyl diphosphate synthase [Gammaproteobacteria bacterium]